MAPRFDAALVAVSSRRGLLVVLLLALLKYRGYPRAATVLIEVGFGWRGAGSRSIRND